MDEGLPGARMRTVLVANRGEIAVRVLRACREAGLTGVAVYSDADAGALHVRSADRAVPLGGETVGESYANPEVLLAAARRAGADAVHPGYGLLSEHAGFARAVTAAGLVWVGPPAEVIALMGDKLAARRTVLAAGVEPVPGTTDPVTSAAEVAAFGDAHGWPVAVKATAGGGGRGIRVVSGRDQAAEALTAAAAEAQASFGDATCYVERFFRRPRHVEVQVLADAAGATVHLGVRDCSVQRRHQKLLEETPAPGLPATVRDRLTGWAVAVAKAVGYTGAGTVEFLFDPDTGGVYFLEMNTRLQVEHPITEAVTGTDLVAAQLRVAGGGRLGFGQEDVRPAGHALEARVNAEDPARGFLPTPGRITRLRWPGGPGVRVDAGYATGDTVSRFYDDLLGKVVVWGRDREAARAGLLAALAETEIDGVASTVPALARILDHDAFRANRHWTTWLEESLAGGSLDFSDLPRQATAAAGEPDLEVEVEGRRWPVRLYRHPPSGAGAAGAGTVTAPLAGTLVRVEVRPGETVAAGALLAVVEAMKMETPVRAAAAGTVTEVRAHPGSPVAAEEVLLQLDTAVDPDSA